MGDPVEVSPETRQTVRELARRIVQSVIDDEAMPLGLFEVPRMPAPMFHRASVESLVMQLAQEIVALTNEKQAFCRAFQVVDVTTKDSE